MTDHKPKQKKFLTANKQEDEEFFRYKQALQEYQNTPSLAAPPKKSKFEKGSLLQKILEPLAAA